MVGFSEEAIVRRRSDITLRVKDVTQYARRQMIAAVEHWRSTGESVDQLLFRLRTMHLAPPSGESPRDDARIQRLEDGIDTRKPDSWEQTG